MPSLQSEGLDGVDGDSLRLGEHVRVDRRGIDVDPADAEADAGWAEPVGQSEREGLATAGDDDSVQLEAVVEALDDRLLGRRFGERGMHVRVELVLRLDVEDAALAAGVGRLQHRRHTDHVESGPSAQHVAGAGEAGLRHARVGERAPHRDLVRHQMSGLDPDPGQAQCLRDCGDDRHGSVGRDGQHTVDGVASRDLRDRREIGEVDRLAFVCGGKTRRVRIPVDGHDAEAELLRAQDGAALVAPRANE